MKPSQISAIDIARMSPVQFAAFCDQLAAETSRIIYDGDLETAAELHRAGWMPEPPTPGCPLMGWRWRRPGLRLGQPGRLFPSPTQAVNALRRAAR